MPTNEDVKKLLQAPTPKDRVKFRIGRKYANNQRAHMLAYVDARYVQDQLDNVIGAENWSNSFEVIDNTLYCSITVVFPDGKVVSKTDCGTESNVEKEKGEASDAFKRAAVMLGIGRDLYDLPNHFNMHADLNEKGFPPKDWTPQGWGDHNHKEQRHVQDKGHQYLKLWVVDSVHARAQSLLVHNLSKPKLIYARESTNGFDCALLQVGEPIVRLQVAAGRRRVHTRTDT